jgi:SAM-dependent methyltransferase
MLDYLGSEFERFGVEPSKEASREAEKRGIKIIADSIESLQIVEPRFGAITLIDVAEHLPAPLDSFRALSQLLLPGGKLFVFTGNTDALSWRLAGIDYYYSAMPEHVVFMGPAWFRWVAPRINCEIALIRPMRYRSSSWREWLDEGLKNILYTAYQRLRRTRVVPSFVLDLPLVRRVGQWQGCWWTSAKDHALVVLTRRGSS